MQLIGMPSSASRVLSSKMRDAASLPHKALFTFKKKLFKEAHISPQTGSRKYINCPPNNSNFDVQIKIHRWEYLYKRYLRLNIYIQTFPWAKYVGQAITFLHIKAVTVTWHQETK